MNKSKWILLAEDDAPTAELTTLALAPDKQTCEIIVAHDGLEALDCIHHRGGFQSRAIGPPAFVLLDLNMPKVGGLEVLRQIKSDAQLRTIPVVIFTSSRDATDVSRSYQLGANAYVVKPVDFRKFRETLKRVALFWARLNEQPPETPSAEVEAHDPSRASTASAHVAAAA